MIVALAGPPALVLVGNWWFGERPPLGAAIALQIVYCAIGGFIVWTVLRKERLPLASIGLHAPRWSTIFVAALLWLVALQLLPILTVPLRDAGATAAPDSLRRLIALPVWFRVVVALTGGVVEEVLYRGYAIERLTTMTGNQWRAAAIATIAFAMAHIPAWGIRYALIAHLPFGVIATLCYLWRRDLLANILAHDVGLLVGVLSVRTSLSVAV